MSPFIDPITKKKIAFVDKGAQEVRAGAPAGSYAELALCCARVPDCSRQLQSCSSDSRRRSWVVQQQGQVAVVEHPDMQLRSCTMFADVLLVQDCLSRLPMPAAAAWPGKTLPHA